MFFKKLINKTIEKNKNIPKILRFFLPLFVLGLFIPSVSEAGIFRTWDKLKQLPWASYYQSSSYVTSSALGKDGKYIYIATSYDGLYPGLEKRNVLNGSLCIDSLICEKEFGIKGLITSQNMGGPSGTFDSRHFTDIKYDVGKNVVYSFGTSQGAWSDWVVDRYNGTTGTLLGRNAIRNTSGHAIRAKKMVLTPGSVIVSGWINTNNTNWSIKQFLIQADSSLSLDTTFGGASVGADGKLIGEITPGTTVVSGTGGMDITDMAWNQHGSSWGSGKLYISGTINGVGKIMAFVLGRPYYPSGAISFTGTFSNSDIRSIIIKPKTGTKGDLLVVARSTDNASSTSDIYKIPLGDESNSDWSPYVNLQNITSIISFLSPNLGNSFFVEKIKYDNTGFYLFGTNQSKLVLEKRSDDGSLISKTRVGLTSLYSVADIVVGGTGLETDPVFASANADYYSIGFKESFIRFDPQLDDKPVRAAHLEDFRESINYLRDMLGLANASWNTTTTIGRDNLESVGVGKPIRAANLVGARKNLFMVNGCLPTEEVITDDIAPDKVIQKNSFSGISNLINLTFKALSPGFSIKDFPNTNCTRGSQSYTTPGSYTFKVPDDVYVIKLEISGGGGGGGGCARDCEYGGGSGGNGGSDALMIYVNPGEPINVVVGGGGKRGIGKVGGIGPGGGGGGGGGGSAFGIYKVGGGGGAGGAKVYETGFNYGDGGSGDNDGGGGGGGGGQGNDSTGGAGGDGGYAGGGGGGAGLGGSGGGVRSPGGVGGVSALPFGAGSSGTCSQRGDPPGCNSGGGGGGSGGNGASGGGASSRDANLRDGGAGSSAISKDPYNIKLNNITPAQGGYFQGYVSDRYKSGANGQDGFVKIYW